MKPSKSSAAPLVPTPGPLVLVLSGPSGAGKDAILDSLKARGLPLAFIVTNTTRPPRPGEVNDVHYHFIPRQEFTRLIDGRELLEHAEVYGHFYGVPKAPVREALARRKDVVIKVDVQGAMTIKKNLPGAVLIFLMPPSIEELAQRLKGRHTESPVDLELRLDTARSEIEKIPLFDYVVISYQNRMEKAASDVECILAAEKLRAVRRQYEL